MTKKATGSTCKDPENRSKKKCVCGGHSWKARKKKKRWSREKLTEEKMDREDIDKAIRKMLINGGPDRVVFNLHGNATTPKRALEEYGVRYDRVFVRNDGWTLGTSEALREVAHSLWKDEWVLQLVKDENGEWDGTLLGIMPSVTRQILPPVFVPITKAEEIVPIAQIFVERFEALPDHMLPSCETCGNADCQMYWHPLVQQLITLRKAIKELEATKQ